MASGNPFIKSPLLILEAFRHYLFLDSYSVHYRPVQNLSYMPDYYFWRDNPFGFHLSNILWHVSSGLGLFFLLRRLLGSLPNERLSSVSRQFLSFLIALLWVVHPVHSAAVDYISGRADSIAFFFACCAWILYLRARGVSSIIPRALLYLTACLLGLFALCARESAMIWLLFFLCYQLFFDRKTGLRNKLAVATTCFALTIAYIGLRHLPAPRLQNAAGPEWSGPVRVTLMLRALGDYARLMIVPSKLHMERTVFDPSLVRDTTGWQANLATEYLSILGLFALTAFTVGALRKERGRDLRILGALWFLIAYLPISNLFDLNATVAEHWLYLPSVGFLLFLAGCVLALPRRSYPWSAGVAVLLALSLSVRSYYRSADWSSEEGFFQQTLSGGGSARAATNLALVYSRRGDYTKAESILRRVLQMSSDEPIARNNLADTLRRLGRNAEAEKILVETNDEGETLRKEYSRSWVIAANLARMRHAQKDDKAAIAFLDQASKNYPDVWELISYKAELLREDEGPSVAQKLVEDFARDNWWHYGAQLALGRLYAQEGDIPDATSALLQASRLDVRDVKALNLLAQIKLRQHCLDDAYLAQRKALARQPDEPRQYVLLSTILEKMGRTLEAHTAVAQVKRLEDLARQNRELLN
ncbi:MAG TPA: tetratricopeptide repeat protein [Chthoniobacterales bacterium]